MIAAALWAGYLTTHPAWPLIFASCCAVAAVFVLYMRAEDRRDDRGAHAAAPGPRVRSRRARPWQRRDRLVPVPEVHHGEYTPPMIAGDSPAGITKIAGHGASPDQGVSSSGGLRLPDVAGRDPLPAGDEAPGPESLPEGDMPAAVTPAGGTGSGDLPPMSPLLAAAIRELEDAERWPHLAKDAGYADGRPFRDWERDSVVMPAIRGL